MLFLFADFPVFGYLTRPFSLNKFADWPELYHIQSTSNRSKSKKQQQQQQIKKTKHDGSEKTKTTKETENKVDKTPESAFKTNDVSLSLAFEKYAKISKFQLILSTLS